MAVFKPEKTPAVTNKCLSHYTRGDAPSTKFDADGVFDGKGIFTPEAFEPTKTKIDALLAKSFDPKKAAKAHVPYQENDDGTISFKVKSKHQPTFFDAKGNKIPPISIGNGSTIKLSVNLVTYSTGANFGVTAYWNGIQIIKLVERGGGNPFGADDDEDGYVHAAQPTNPFGTDDDEVEATVDDNDGDF